MPLPERPATAAAEPQLALGLAEFGSLDSSFSIVICYCHGLARGIQLAPTPLAFRCPGGVGARRPSSSGVETPHVGTDYRRADPGRPAGVRRRFGAILAGRRGEDRREARRARGLGEGRSGGFEV